MTSHVINLILLEQFHILTYSKVVFLLIIYHLTYLTFLVNFLNQFFKSTFELTYAINIFNQSILNWQCY